MNIQQKRTCLCQGDAAAQAETWVCLCYPSFHCWSLAPLQFSS